MAMLNRVGVTNMNQQACEIFAQLLEAYVNEASTSMNLITGKPGGEAVVKHLHKDLQLAHDLNYRQIEKISWSDLKESYRGAWVIIVGSNGVGAIKARGGSTGSYDAVASAGGEVRTSSDSRGGNIIDFLKGEIGKLQKFYVAKNTSAVSDKQRKRADQQKGAGAAEVTQETLMKKFKPLWIKAMNAAIADIKGHVANQIKNDAFDKAKRKLNHIESLQNNIEQIEAGSSEIPGFIQSSVNSAVLMAASYHYPEQTGNIERSRYGGGMNSQFPEGPRQLLKDISEGDTKKLGTVLNFFKRSLISG